MLIALTLPLLVAELALRTVSPLIPGNYRTAPFAVPSDVVGRLNKANSSGWRKTDEYVTHVTINSQNLRGHETTYAKPADTYRVIVLGDSFVFAVQVDEPDTLVSRLATSLQPPAPFTKIETINAGTDGWSTTNELAWLTTEGVHYEPDLVLLLFFVGNDPGENADRVDGWLTARQAPGPLRDLRMALAERSAFYSYLEYGVIANLSASQDTTHQPIDETHTDDARRQDPTRQDRGWAISGELLARMRALSIERQFDLVVVNVPTVELVSNPDWPERPLRGITDRLGIPMIDLLSVFRDEPRDRQRRLYFRGNKHWTPSGHELATRVVTEQLTQRGLRSPRTGSS